MAKNLAGQSPPFVKKIHITKVRGHIVFNEQPQMTPQEYTGEVIGLYKPDAIKKIIENKLDCMMIVQKVEHVTRTYTLDYDTLKEVAKVEETPFKKQPRKEQRCLHE